MTCRLSSFKEGVLHWEMTARYWKAQHLRARVEAVLAAQPEAQAGGVVVWRPMATAPRDGTMLRLLVRFTEHSTEDDEIAPTIGAWSADGDPDGAWQFAGWCWTHDHFTEGKGEPMGWLPLLDTTPPPSAVPAGWKLVPLKPTREMWDAWHSAPDIEDDEIACNRAYAAMLAAAPAPNKEANRG